MHQLAAQVGRYGLPFVFINVLLEQLGLPIPAIPTLVVAGALVARGDMSGPEVLLAALTASLLADTVWYFMGRRQGHRILKTVCRISLSPDSCVRRTESLFERLGMPSLLVAKFIPGFSTVAPPLAGAMRASLPSFLLYDGGGTLIWSGAGIGAGLIFHDAIDRVAAFLEGLGSWALVILASALLLFAGIKWWQRRSFFKFLRSSRIPIHELKRLMDDGHDLLLVDVRSSVARKLDPRRIPGAIVMEVSEAPQKLSELPRDREIILYCT